LTPVPDVVFCTATIAASQQTAGESGGRAL